MKSRLILLVFAFVVTLALGACGGGGAPAPAAAKPADAAAATAAVQKGTCGACHIIPGIPGATGVVGPDLSKIGARGADTIKDPSYSGKAQSVADYLRESVKEPDIFLASGCPGGACPKGTMPATLAGLLSESELAVVVDYLATLK